MTAINSYSDFKASLEERGIKTTRTGQKEANFADYGNALGSNVKQMVMDSFDNEQDYALQSRLAAAFKNKNVINMSDIKAFCKANGIQCNIEYVQTQYIVDNKKGGKYANNTNATNGNIAVYTFSDGQGGEIKIADANGNGALESEELFMNEILSGISSDLAAGNAVEVSSSDETKIKSASNDFLSKLDSILERNEDKIKETKEEEEEEAAEEAEENENIQKFYDKVNELMKSEGYSEIEAVKAVLVEFPSLAQYAPDDIF